MAGVADLFIMAARAEYDGLFVEIKLPKGRAQESQQHFENLCFRKMIYLSARNVLHRVT